MPRGERTMVTYTLKVTLTCPSLQAYVIEEYVRSAVATLKGSFDPFNPLFDLVGSSVEATVEKTEK